MKVFNDETGSNRECASPRVVWISALVCLLVLLTIAGASQPTLAQAPPAVGSQQPATADPSVPVPPTTPIRVQLFSNLKFTNFDVPTFTYTPPAQTGPWAKIVLVANFKCTAGRQFDRTAEIFLGNTNIYYGTTQEPQKNVSPAWKIERDLTDYAPLFATAQTGDIVLGNIVNSTYTGILSASASLLFYPAGPGAPAASTANVVLPLNSSGNAALLPDPTTPLSATFTFPTNVVQAYLDVIMQSQIGDEDWFLGVPSDLAGELETGGGTGFREGEISIDGTPAGVAPVYPWIYTGGIDPYWWRPIPGVQAYNFAPYRVDLTPFAAVLDDGQPHTVAINVYNDNNYFNVTGTLLLYTDPNKAQVTGAVTKNTIGVPDPTVKTHIVKNPKTGEITGPVVVTSDRQFTVEGYVDTSGGRVDTKIYEKIDFSNKQNFDITSTLEEQNLVQDETLDVSTTTRQGTRSLNTTKYYDWPLTINYMYGANPDGSAYQTASADQEDNIAEIDSILGVPVFASEMSNEVTPSDTIVFNTDGTYAPTNPTNTQTYTYYDTLGDSWYRSISAADLAVTSVSDGHNSLPNWWLPGDFLVPVN